MRWRLIEDRNRSLWIAIRDPGFGRDPHTENRSELSDLVLPELFDMLKSNGKTKACVVQIPGRPGFPAVLVQEFT